MGALLHRAPHAMIPDLSELVEPMDDDVVGARARYTANCRRAAARPPADPALGAPRKAILQ